MWINCVETLCFEQMTEFQSTRRNPFIDPRISVANSHTEIELWTQAANQAFTPFVRRRSVLVQNREIFRVELINLLPILDDPQLVTALSESVRLCRKAIYSDPLGSHSHQITLFPETSQADGRWLSLAASTKPLGIDAGPEDRAAQIMTVIDAMTEGCIKPRLMYLFGFAHRVASGFFQQRAYGLGESIQLWPSGLTPTLRSLMDDPIFGVAISQWRNIAAHRSYRRVGPDLFEATYGRNLKSSIKFSFEQLDAVTAWAKQLLAVCRMANVIIDIEFMPQLKRLGLPSEPIRFDAYMITLSHNLRMVGFSYVFEKQAQGKIEVLFEDDLKRNPQDSIIHLSQVLDQLALASISDIALREVIEQVGVGLVTSEGTVYASASVAVDVALRRLDRKLSLEQYVNQINFWIAPRMDHAK